jgi:hypothetical protein
MTLTVDSTLVRADTTVYTADGRGLAIIVEAAVAIDLQLSDIIPKPQVISLLAVQEAALTAPANVGSVVSAVSVSSLTAIAPDRSFNVTVTSTGLLKASATVYYNSSLTASAPSAQYFAVATVGSLFAAVKEQPVYASAQSRVLSASVNTGQIFVQATIYYQAIDIPVSYIAAA